MKQILKFIIICIISTIYLHGKIVTIKKAEQVAKNWFNSSSISKQRSLIISNTTTQNLDNEPVLHFINFHNGGFVIVSADDNVQPILGYSFTESINEKVQNSGLSYFINSYGKRIIQSRKNLNKSVPNSQITRQWKQLETNSITTEVNIEPFVTTRWDQNFPYNAMCPIDSTGPGNHVYAGCVATTMGQIMKYYNYPDTGNGSYSFTHSEYGLQSAMFDTTNYKWVEMPIILSKWASYDKYRDIAELLYHCSISVDMNYGPDGSGAYSVKAREAFESYFKYSPEINKVSRGNYSDTNWKNLLISELYDQRPIYYSGQNSDDDGHAFVCDGYQSILKQGDYFHFNWGWSGSGNGYFSVNDMDFNDNQSIIYNIAPYGQMAKFESDYNRGVVPLTVQFADLSEGNPTSWKWDFNNDGVIDSEEQNPTWTYTDPGEYSVVLIAGNDSITYRKTKANNILVISSDEIFGTIATDRILDSDIVTVKDDVKIGKGVTLTIKPGTSLVFEDLYKIEVNGTINAVGTKDDSISFLIEDTTGFSKTDSNTGGWGGIFINAQGSTADSSEFQYCNFKNVKNNICLWSIKCNNFKISNSTFLDNRGVAVGAWFTNLTIKNIIINKSTNSHLGATKAFGSCITAYNSDININNCAITNNTAGDKGIIMASNSNIQINNSTISDNHAVNNSGNMLNIMAGTKLNILNSILWNDNLNEIKCSGNTECSVEYSNLQNGLREISGDIPEFQSYIGNINISPEFVSNGYQLHEWSQCINRGHSETQEIGPELFDLADNPRIFENTIDIGAYEFQSEKTKFDIGFTSSVQSGDFPLNVDFSDTSKIDDILKVKWDFNSDGSWDAEDENSTWTYHIPGNYSVTMLILNSDSIPIIEYKENLINVTGIATEIVESPEVTIPQNFYLNQNYPNPFNPSTRILYGLSEKTHINITIYDLLGSKVAVLVNEIKSAGNYIIKWNGNNSNGLHLPSGIYVYKMETAKFIDTKKMFLIK